MSHPANDRFFEEQWSDFENANDHDRCGCGDDAVDHNPETGKCLRTFGVNKTACRCEMFHFRGKMEMLEAEAEAAQDRYDEERED